MNYELLYTEKKKETHFGNRNKTPFNGLLANHYPNSNARIDSTKLT